MNVLILKPRLDCSFKPGPVLSKRGTIPKVRVPFNFVCDQIKGEYESRGCKADILEKPLWQFNTKMVENCEYDLVFVPHKDRFNFPINNKQVLYYMQMVIPHFFSIDPKGWLATASYYPLQLVDDDDPTNFNTLSKRVDQELTKFDQPPRQREKFPHRNYVLFICQIPHDEVIRYHSYIEVIEALQCVIDYCKTNNKKLIVKGHPVNKPSMSGLKALCNQNKITYTDNINIFDAIEYSDLVCLVNSGVGFESILMKKPVVSFGRSEYDVVVNNANKENYMEVIGNASCDEKDYFRFINTWVATMYDSFFASDFKRLP